MSSRQARGRSSPPVHESKVVQYLKDGHSSSFRHPLYSPYQSMGHLSVDRGVVSPNPLLYELRLLRASPFPPRACNTVQVEDGSHRMDIRPTSGSLTLHGDGSGYGGLPLPANAHSACALHDIQGSPTSVDALAACPMAMPSRSAEVRGRGESSV